MHMGDWFGKLRGFLTLNDRDILSNAGKISHEMAKELAEGGYERFNQLRIDQADIEGGNLKKRLSNSLLHQRNRKIRIIERSRQSCWKVKHQCRRGFPDVFALESPPNGGLRQCA